MKLLLTDSMLAELKAENFDQVLARLCIAGKLLAPIFDDSKVQLKERLAGVPEIVTPDGVRLYLEEKPGIREVVGKQEAWHRLAGYTKEEFNELGESVPVFVPGALDEEDALQCVKISVSDTEKVLAEKLGLPLSSKRGDSGKARAETLFDGLVERRPSVWLMIT